MGSELVTSRFRRWPREALAGTMPAGEGTSERELTPRGAAAATAMVAPEALDRLAGWPAGLSLAFTIVAVGRVPAAAIIAALASMRNPRR